MDFDCKRFFEAVVKQDADALGGYFADDAVINWHDTNESFNVAEYIRANCEYPGDWDGHVVRAEEVDGGVVVVGKIAGSDISLHVASFIKLEGGKIARMDEYFGDCGTAPQWRRDMNIGRPIV